MLTRWRLHLDSAGQLMDRRMDQRHTAAGPARCHRGGPAPPWRFESLWLPPTTSRANPYSRGEYPCWELHGGLGARRRVRGWREGLLYLDTDSAPCKLAREMCLYIRRSPRVGIWIHVVIMVTRARYHTKSKCFIPTLPIPQLLPYPYKIRSPVHKSSDFVAHGCPLLGV